MSVIQIVFWIADKMSTIWMGNLQWTILIMDTNTSVILSVISSRGEEVTLHTKLSKNNYNLF